MTVQELRVKFNAVLSVADIITSSIPGDVDDRIVQYVRVLASSDELWELLHEDFFLDGPFGSSGQEVVLKGADGKDVGLDPVVIALFIQLVVKYGPTLRELIQNWRRNR